MIVSLTRQGRAEFIYRLARSRVRNGFPLFRRVSGGGGFVGSIQNAARWSVHSEYATVGTDTRHEGGGTDASWALNHPERQINFGHLAVHRTAETAKAIIRAHYGSDIDYSYFLRCSRGGPGPGEVNWLNVLTDWVEQGKAPDRIVALKRNAAREVVRSRPLCPYPQRAVYDGEGDTDDADSFACAAP